MKNILSGKLFPIACVIAIVGAVLLLAPSFFTKKDTTTQLLTNAASKADADFIKETENSIISIVQAITGSEPMSVVITLESGTQYIYHSDSSISQSSTQSKLVTLSVSGGEQPILVQEVLPKVMGAVIICKGINADSFEYKITEAVKTALGISASRIFVSFT